MKILDNVHVQEDELVFHSDEVHNVNTSCLLAFPFPLWLWNKRLYTAFSRSVSSQNLSHSASCVFRSM